MGLFKRATNLAAFLKAGFLGFPGSGKTVTAGLTAIGLHKLIETKEPVTMIDTENGSDFLIPLFKAADVPFEVAKTRAFQDLISGVEESEKKGSILIVDSISHIWVGFVQQYLAGKGKTDLRFNDWNVLKTTWSNIFTTPRFLNSNLHFFMLGRAGYEYDVTKDEHGNVEDIIKSGVKMKGESEMGYEPSLLVRMEMIQKTEKGLLSDEIENHALVMKDRSMTINGKRFIMKKFDANKLPENFWAPTFNCFLPHIQKLNLGGKHKAIDQTRQTDPAVFKAATEPNNLAEQKKILIEEIKGELKSAIPGKSKEDTQLFFDTVQKVFDTRSWTKVESLANDQLLKGLEKIRKMFGTFRKK